MPGGIRECNNHCEFCFIRGLPSGLRPTLYVFDDDYRYSFLWGNFLTLTNLAEADWARIGSQRLSPLNVSVHATDPAMRRRLLNNRHAPAILPQLERLGALGVQVNAQVVLCAGINDGAVLERTIDDLVRLHPSVRSLSVVPVGLTRYSRTRNIRRPLGATEARAALSRLRGGRRGCGRTLGSGFVYGSDELYLLARRPELPGAEAYDGFPVLSNGVGMLRAMLDAWERLLAARRKRGVAPPRARRQAWVTGHLAAPALRGMAERWQKYAGWAPEVVLVDNTFFGEQVTVSGLLGGEDLVRALRALDPGVEDVVLPRAPSGLTGSRRSMASRPRRSAPRIQAECIWPLRPRSSLSCSADGYQLSAIGYQLSVCRLPVTSKPASSAYLTAPSDQPNSSLRRSTSGAGTYRRRRLEPSRRSNSGRSGTVCRLSAACWLLNC